MIDLIGDSTVSPVDMNRMTFNSNIREIIAKTSSINRKISIIAYSGLTENESNEFIFIALCVIKDVRLYILTSDTIIIKILV